MVTADLLEYSKTTLSNKSQLSSRYNFRQILSPLVQETNSDMRDNKSLNTQNPLLTDKSTNDKAFILVTEEPDQKELMQTCFSGSVIESHYLRQNEITTTEECETEADILEPSFMNESFKKQNLQAEVLDYKQLTQNALRNIEMLQKQTSQPPSTIKKQQKQAESQLSLKITQQNISTYESNRHDSQKSLISESMIEKTPKIYQKSFNTNPIYTEWKIQNPQETNTKSMIEQCTNEYTQQYKTSPERYRHFSFSETKRRASEANSENDYVEFIKIEQNSYQQQQQAQNQVTISEIQQQQMNMTLGDHMRMQDYTDQPIMHSHIGYHSQMTEQPLQVRLRTRNNSTGGGSGHYFNGFIQNESKLDHSSIQQFMTYDSSDNRLNSAQNDYSKMNIGGGHKFGSIHNESITEKIRMLRDDIHQLFPSGQRPQQDLDSLFNGLTHIPLAKSVERSSRVHPKPIASFHKAVNNRPQSIPPKRDISNSINEIQLVNVQAKQQQQQQTMQNDTKNTEDELRLEVSSLQQKLIKQKLKLKDFKDRTTKRKESEVQKYQGEIQQLKVELKSIEEKYSDEVKRLEQQYAKYRQAKHSKFNKIMKELQTKYEQQVEKERQLRNQLEVDFEEAKLKIEMIQQQMRHKNISDHTPNNTKIAQKVEKQKEQEWKDQNDKVKREYENKMNEMRNRYESMIKENINENQEKFELELNLLREQKQKLFDENRKLNNQLSVLQFKNENASCTKCQSLLMTNSRLLVKLNKYANNDADSQSKKSASRETTTNKKQNFNLDYYEDTKPARKSLEPCYSRQSKTGRLRDQQFRDKQNATTVDFKSALSDRTKTSNKTRMNHTKRDSKQSQRSCERRKTYRDLPLQNTASNMYMSSDDDENGYHHN